MTVQNVFVIHGDFWRCARPRASSDHDNIPRNGAMTPIWGQHVEFMRRHKARPAMPLRHTVTLQLFAHIALVLVDNPLQTGHQMSHFEVFAHLHIEEFRAALLKTHDGLRALAQRLAWNGAIVHTGAPDAHVLLDDQHALSELCPLNSGLLPRGSTTDHYNVIVLHDVSHPIASANCTMA